MYIEGRKGSVGIYAHVVGWIEKGNRHKVGSTNRVRGIFCPDTYSMRAAAVQINLFCHLARRGIRWYCLAMPAQILHILHGKRTLELVLREQSGTAAAAKSAGSATLLGLGFLSRLLESPDYPFFCLGCQGPDLFYHNQRTRPSAIEYGSLLHRRSYGDFAGALLALALGEFSGRPESEQAIAFAFGFFMHPYLDRLLHPYIIHKSGAVHPGALQMASAAQYHMLLERIIDVLMLERYAQTPLSGFDQHSLLVEPAVNGASNLVPLLAAAIREVFPSRVQKDTMLEERLFNSFRDAARFYSLTDPKSPIPFDFPLPGDEQRSRALTAMLYPLSIELEYDFLNLGNHTWCHPCDAHRKSLASVPELFDEAVQESAQGLAFVFSEIGSSCPGRLDLRERAARAVGNYSLSSNDEQTQRCLPRFFDPFPFDRILEHQFLLRKSQK